MQSILWLSHFLPFPPKGHGALQRSGNLLRYLNAHAEVTVLALTKQVVPGDRAAFQRELSKEFKNIEFFSDSWDQHIVKKFAAGLSPLLSNRPYSAAVYTSSKLTSRTEELLDSGRFHILHVDTLGLAEKVLQRKRCPVVINHHNIESSMMRRRAAKLNRSVAQSYLQREAKALEVLENSYCPRVDLNIVVSELDGELLKKVAPGSKVAVVPNSVDVEFFANSAKFEERRGAVFIGGIDWYPNREAAFYCKDAIWPLVKDLTLTFVGSDTEKLNNPAHRINGTGTVPDVRKYLAASRIFICPIRDGGGTRTKLLDAMASGTPIVSTTLGAEGLNITSGEHLLIADDPVTFAAYIIALNSDRNLWERLSAAGKEFVRANYSVAVAGDKLLQAYRSISTNIR